MTPCLFSNNWTESHTYTCNSVDSQSSDQIHPASRLSGIRHILQQNQSMTCNGNDRVTLNGCHSEGLHMDVFASLKGHVCISGTNRQRIWHCHRNMWLRMDAANEGPPVLIQPDLSIVAVIIYFLHLLCHTHTHTQNFIWPAASTPFFPPTWLSLRYSEGCRSPFQSTHYSEMRWFAAFTPRWLLLFAVSEWKWNKEYCMTTVQQLFNPADQHPAAWWADCW